MGFTDEAAGLGRWLAARVHEQVGGEGGPLNIMYRVDGSSDLIEETLPHWEGYKGSSPVRIGNGAADQLQLDIYGEAIDSLYFANQHGLEGGHPGWPAGVHLRTADELGRLRPGPPSGNYARTSGAAGSLAYRTGRNL